MNSSFNSEAAPAAGGGAEIKARLLRWSMPALVVLATLAAFLPSLQNGFVGWDDDKNLLDNPYYRGLGLTQLRWMFTDLGMGHYQPLSWMSLGLDYLLWGMNPFGYHLTSLVLHGINAALFYFLALRLLRLSVSFPSGERALRLAAGLSALFFSIHPLRAEAVAWATERRGVLAGLFFLSSLLCYLKASSIPEESGARLHWLIFSLTTYGLSLLSKASGIALPAVLLALDVYPLRRLRGGVREWLGKSNRRVWLEKAPFFVLGLLAAAITFAAEREAGAIVASGEQGVVGRVSQALFRLAFYLWKTLVPAGLTPLYGSVGDAVPATWGMAPSEGVILGLSAIVVVALSLVLFLLRRRWPSGAANGVCYVAMLLPVLGAVQIGAQIVADRYSYLATLGWALLAGAGVLYGWRSGWGRWVVGGTGAVLVLFGILTWRQAEVWHDSERLWRHVLNVGRGSSTAHYNLAIILSDRGESAEAMEHYRQALRFNPRDAVAHSNLGVILAGYGELEEAIGHYREALRINPQFAEAHNNLGNVLYAHGRLEQAMGRSREALRIKPHLAEAQRNLAKAHETLSRALAAQGKKNEALQHRQEARRLLNPGPEVPAR